MLTLRISKLAVRRTAKAALNSYRARPLSIVPDKGAGQKSLFQKSIVLSKQLASGTKSVVVGIGSWTKDVIMNPRTIPGRCSNMWVMIKEEAHHYYVSSSIVLEIEIMI